MSAVAVEGALAVSAMPAIGDGATSVVLGDDAATAVRATIDGYVVAVDVSVDGADGAVGARLNVVAALGDMALRALRRMVAGGAIAAVL